MRVRIGRREERCGDGMSKGLRISSATSRLVQKMRKTTSFAVRI